MTLSNMRARGGAAQTCAGKQALVLFSGQAPTIQQTMPVTVQPRWPRISFPAYLCPHRVRMKFGHNGRQVTMTDQGWNTPAYGQPGPQTPPPGAPQPGYQAPGYQAPTDFQAGGYQQPGAYLQPAPPMSG